MINVANNIDDIEINIELAKELILERKKINLGCNKDIREGYANIDILPIKGVDIVEDLTELYIWAFPACQGKVTSILAYDILEHFPFQEVKFHLSHWINFLDKGGEIIVRVPDLERIAKKIVDKTLPVFEAQRLIYGGQDYRSNFHMAGFTGEYLEGLMLGCGCSEIVQVVREPFDHNVVVVGRK